MLSFRRLAAFLLMCVCLYGGDLMAGTGAQTPTNGLITVTYPTGVRILAELADTTPKRAQGLMFREHLPDDRGMLFVFNEPGQWTFWMKNTKVSLDILWLGADKRIVDAAENVPGCAQDPCLQYTSNKDALYVLEIPGGSMKKQKLAKGMRLEFELPKK